MKRRIFFILGMHRSGTSYLTQALSLLGLELPKSIQPDGAPDNTKGFFESYQITQYHDKLLQQLNSSWDSFISIPESWFASEYAEQAIQQLTEIFQQDFPDVGPMVLKDPRLSLFLPLWQKLAKSADLQAYCIIPLRHPANVADSLYRRNTIGIHRSCLIWLNYLFSAEKYSRGNKRSFIQFPEWPLDFEKTIAKMEQDLGTNFPKKHKQNLIKANNEFESKLVHNTSKELRVVNNDIQSLCLQTYEVFLKLINNASDTNALAKIDTLRAEFDGLSVIYEEVIEELDVKYNKRLEQQVQELYKREITAQVGALQQQLNAATAGLNEQKQLTQFNQSRGDQAVAQVDVLLQQLNKATVHINDQEQKIQASNKTAKHVAEQKDVIQQQLNEALAQVDTLHQKLSKVEGQFSQSEQRLKASQNAKQKIRTQADELQQQLSKTVDQLTQLQQQLQENQSNEQKTQAQVDELKLRLKKTTGRIVQLEQKLQESKSSRQQMLVRLETTEQQQNSIRAQVSDLEQQLREERESSSTLKKEINELKVKNRALTKEYEQLVLSYNKEQLTVIKPLYRNLYRNTGLLLRNTLPSAWVASIKKITPNPNGVPKQLTYQAELSRNGVNTCVDFVNPSIHAAPDVFVLSIINWDFRYQRPQHIAKGIADSGSRVFYLEMELADNATQITKIADKLYCVRLSGQETGHIQAYTGQPNPEQVHAWINAFYHLCNVVKATSVKQIIIQHPFWWQLSQHLSPEFQIIFDCMDDISGFSNTEQFLLDLEQDMLKKCDRLLVSSQYLYDKYKHFQQPILIRNAAELTHFQAKKIANKAPALLKLESSAQPRSHVIKVGYVGAIAEWFDTEIIKQTALSNNNIEFHLCGAVTVPEAAQLAKLENIHMYGEIPYADVPHLLQAMDVMIIPFKIIPIIQACDPVKFYEYSAMAKPTVTTALPELKRASALTFVASTPKEFAEQIHKANKAGKKRNFRKQLQSYAANNTWQHRITQFQEILNEIPKVSVVILSYGDPELTKAALHSLYDGGIVYANLEVLVVDNGSSAKAIKAIRHFSANYTDVKIIENNKNLGFARGNNVGLEQASGEYVMLLNNDTVVSPGSIYAMIRHLQHNPSFGVVGPLTNNIGNEAKLFVDYEDMNQMREVARQATTGYRGVATEINVVAYFAVMFRRADIETFGLLSEDYGRGMFEDDDHCARIKAKGYACVLAEDAFIHHHLSATFSKLKDGEKERLFANNKKIFENKWGAWQPHKYREKRPVSTIEQNN